MVRKITILLLLLVGCSSHNVYAPYEATDTRWVCHMKFRLGEWWPVEQELQLWTAYRDHIGMHPNDYWGKCQEEIRPIPPIDGPVDWESKGYFGEPRGRRWREE